MPIASAALVTVPPKRRMASSFVMALSVAHLGMRYKSTQQETSPVEKSTKDVVGSNPDMVSLENRIAQAEEAGFTQARIAEALGITSSAVNQWARGRVKTLKSESAAGLAKLTGWSYRWWATGKGLRTADDTPPPDAPIPLAEAIATVLAAVSESQEKDELRQLLPLLVTADAPAYRDRLLELLERAGTPSLDEDASAAPDDVRLFGGRSGEHPQAGDGGVVENPTTGPRPS